MTINIAEVMIQIIGRTLNNLIILIFCYYKNITNFTNRFTD